LKAIEQAFGSGDIQKVREELENLSEDRGKEREEEQGVRGTYSV
jgi:hypothetical protein